MHGIGFELVSDRFFWNWCKWNENFDRYSWINTIPWVVHRWILLKKMHIRFHGREFYCFCCLENGVTPFRRSFLLFSENMPRRTLSLPILWNKYSFEGRSPRGREFALGIKVFIDTQPSSPVVPSSHSTYLFCDEKDAEISSETRHASMNSSLVITTSGVDSSFIKILFKFFQFTFILRDLRPYSRNFMEI